MDAPDHSSNLRKLHLAKAPRRAAKFNKTARKWWTCQEFLRGNGKLSASVPVACARQQSRLTQKQNQTLSQLIPEPKKILTIHAIAKRKRSIVIQLHPGRATARNTDMEEGLFCQISWDQLSSHLWVNRQLGSWAMFTNFCTLRKKVLLCTFSDASASHK